MHNAIQTLDLRHRVYMITGANSGIGRVTAETLASRGAKVYLACRSAERTLPVVEAIRAKGGKAEFLELNLADLESVRRCADTFLDSGESLHVLVNNAGLASQRGVTKDGFEIAFGTNHLGHFLLTTSLLPRLREAEDARIVTVGSLAHTLACGVDFTRLQRPTRSLTGMPEYNVSKLCNVLFTQELARGEAGGSVRSYVVHPGIVATELWNKVPALMRPLVTSALKTAEEGAETTLHCATASGLRDEDGVYYSSSKPKKPSRASQDSLLARQLWDLSLEWTAKRSGKTVS